MLKTLFGTKDEMGQEFIEGNRVSVTKILIRPSVVTQLKSIKKDGYSAVQIGYDLKKTRNTKKPILTQLKGVLTGNKAPRFLREVKIEGETDLKVGTKINISDVVSEGDVVSVTGVSKGKGFAGVVKRWDFKGSSRTHGQKSRRRAPGSIGQGTTPGKVRKGKKMGGRMGGDTVHVSNLKVIKVDVENSSIMVSGSVPGSRGTLLTITKK